MLELEAAARALGVLLAVGFAAWLVSLGRRDVSLVDSLWPLFFLLALVVYLVAAAAPLAPRGEIVLALTTVWALRLCGHLTWRNHGKPEDRRYAAMRARNDPGFAWKSLYLVFGLQAVLAWVIAAPLFAASASRAPLGALDVAGIALWTFGFALETVADAQLARFANEPSNRGGVMDRGVWRYTRHPNYFGEACVWWGYWLLAAGGGGAWSVFAPILVTVLLLKVSGVALLERDIARRRPAYRAYAARTNAFVPGLPHEEGGRR